MDKLLPPLNLDELRRLKWLLGGALALIALGTIIFLEIEALGLVGVAASLIIAAMLWPVLPSRVPALVWRGAVPVIILILIADLYFSPDTLPALIRLAILLVLYRSVSYRRKREDLQLILLALFLVVVAGVLTVALEFAFLLVLFTGCALGFLFVVTLIDLTENTRQALTYEEMSRCPAWALGPWRPYIYRLRQVADWRWLGFASGLFFCVVIFSTVLFIVIPRFEITAGFFLDQYITKQSRTGFTEVLKFGDVGTLIQDDRVALRVDVTDPAILGLAPYWRLVALDEYTADGFRVSAGLKQELLRSQTVTQQITDQQLGSIRGMAAGSWTFYLEPGVSRFLPIPGRYRQLRLREPMPLQASRRHRLVALRTEAMTMTAFQLEAVELTDTIPDPRFAQLLRAAQDNRTTHSTQDRADAETNLRGPLGPVNAPILRRINTEIIAGAALTPVEYAHRAIAWLQAHHAYALSVKLPAGDGQDAIVRWLASSEPGFCEYFAASFVLLARSADYPARVVAGFHGGIWNGVENYFMVRNSDAHAWAEIYDGTGSWLRMEPTPGLLRPSSTIAQAGSSFAPDRSWRARLDSVRVLWYRRIVNFDSRTQVAMVEQVTSFTTELGSAWLGQLAKYPQRLKTWWTQPWNLARVRELLIGILVPVALVGLLLRWGRWGWWRSRWGPADYDPVRRTAGRWLTQLAAGPDDDVMADLRRLRYGPRETWPEAKVVFRRAKIARRRGRSR
jgi:transglutaminase-like putative cysteine protease